MKKLLLLTLILPLISKAQFCIMNYGNVSSFCNEDSAFFKDINDYVAQKKTSIHFMIKLSDTQSIIEYGNIIGIGKVQKSGPARLLRMGKGIIITSFKEGVKRRIDYAIRNYYLLKKMYYKKGRR